MLSVCIPVYNHDTRLLVKELSDQIKRTNFSVDLILIDDCSSEHFRNMNAEISNYAQVVQLDKNIGRARIRNLFLTHTSSENLLFLDCDSSIISSDYISKYLSILDRNKVNVVCGGRVYPSERPDKNHNLRWKYGVKKESKNANFRMQYPNKSFMTNNFVIRRDVFEANPFDERIRTYGHEDTLFGYQLKQKGIMVSHIENPILNSDLETNEEFLKKTEEAIYSLVSITHNLNDNQQFIQDVTILKYYNRIESKKMLWLVSMFFVVLRRFILKWLSVGFVSLLLFDFYKLGLLTKAFNRSSSMKKNSQYLN